MADVRQVYADLMGAPCLQAALDQAGEGPFGIAELFDKAIPRTGHPAAVTQDCHAFAVERISTDRSFNDAFACSGRAPDNSVIGTLDGVVGKLLGKACHGTLALGGNEQSAGILVEAMNDAGPSHTANTRQ